MNREQIRRRLDDINQQIGEFKAERFLDGPQGELIADLEDKLNALADEILDSQMQASRRKSKQVNALKVMVTDRRIRGWLTDNDPQALRQVVDALQATGWVVPKEVTVALAVATHTEEDDRG